MSDDPGTVLRHKTVQYAMLFEARDLDGIAGLLCDDVCFSDPNVRLVRGRGAVLEVYKGIFASAGRIICTVRDVRADGDTTVLEFQLEIGSIQLEGVDVIGWRDGRIATLRAYVNALLPVEEIAIVTAEPPQVFIIDVDGVMTDGSQYYTAEGKLLKRFGPDDHDALSILSRHLDVRFVSGDKRGFPISERRVKMDMKFPIDLVSTIDRTVWIAERYPLERVVYMGDGIFDALVFATVAYAIAPADADPIACAKAHYVTTRPGGKRAVSEAAVHLMERFFGGFDLFTVERSSYKASGA